MQNYKNNKAISLTDNQLVKYFIVVFISIIAIHQAHAQQNICQGSINTYIVDGSENGGTGTTGSTYQWTITNPQFQGVISLTSPPATNAITIDWLTTPSGNYTLKVVETNSQGCTSVQNLQITIYPKPAIHLTDQIACVHPVTGQFIQPLTINTGLSSTNYNFEWFHDGTALSNNTPSLTVNTPGNYSITATQVVSGCSTSTSTTISVSSAPIAGLSVNEPFQATQTIHVIIYNGSGDYEYALNNGSFQDSPYFTVQEPGEYEVIVRDKNFCGETRLVAHVINFPPFFTPNNDGFNDTWNVIGLPSHFNAKISIFDRYGKLLFQFNPKTSYWNGQYNNQPVPSTDYWFTIDYTDDKNNKHSYQSHFSLVR